MIGAYARDPQLAFNYENILDKYDEEWQQLRALVMAGIQEELKYGPMPPGSINYVLDKLIADKFPSNIKPLKLLDLRDKLLGYLPEGKRLADLPGTSEIGRALISFSSDICVIDDYGNGTVVDIMPSDYERVAPIEILEIKYLLMSDYLDTLTYYLYSPTTGMNIRRRQVIARNVDRKKVYISLQYWYTGYVNRIALEEGRVK